MKKTIGTQAEVLSNISILKKDLYKEQEIVNATCAEVINALQQFSECIRYLNTRRSSGITFDFNNEAAVQDLIYIMLRPWIHDVTPETPTEKVANRYTIKDFLIKSAKTVIEAKFVRDINHGKNISKELHDDIENYRHNPDCNDLIFFIYDPDSNIPDVAALKRTIEENRVYNGRALYCHVIVP